MSSHHVPFFWSFSVSVSEQIVTVTDDQSGQTSSEEDELDGDSSMDGGNMLSIYRVGNGSRCVIWNYDIFGFNGGRTREITDLIASKGIDRIFNKRHRVDFRYSLLA